MNWISVKERLPENETVHEPPENEYLVWFQDRLAVLPWHGEWEWADGSYTC